MSAARWVDADDVAEVLSDITPRRTRRRGQWAEPAAAEDEDMRGTGLTIKRFLDEIPGEASVSELREALEEAMQR